MSCANVVILYGLKSGPRNHEHIEQNHSFFSLLFSFFSYDEMAREKREVQWSDDKSDKKLQHDDEHVSPYSTYIRARNRKKEERFSFCVLQIESCPCPPGQAFPEKSVAFDFPSPSKMGTLVETARSRCYLLLSVKLLMHIFFLLI